MTKSDDKPTPTWEPAELRPQRDDETQGRRVQPTRRVEPTRRIDTTRETEPARQDADATQRAEPTRRIDVSSQKADEASREQAAEPTRRVQPTRRVDAARAAEPTRPARAAARDDERAATTRQVPTWEALAQRGEATQAIPAGEVTQAIPAQGARKGRGRWATVLLTLTLIGVGLFFLALLGGIVGYIALAAQLPAPEELRQLQPNFASSQIYDREGKLLHEIIDPTAGKRTYVPISQISRYLQLATVATEDRNFYAHTGFDPIAVIRAVYYVILEGEVVSGASTITQQVARNILLPEERFERTLSRKIKEIVLATELTRRYTKDEILEIYLNNNNYGNLAYGVDAAARTYFGTSAAHLTLTQASFLAGLPQAPARYNPFRGGREAALKRQEDVLALMVEADFITSEEADAAAAEMAAYEFEPVFTDRIPAPHFVTYVRQQLEAQLGPEALYTGKGLSIHTTIDMRLQRIAEEEVATGVAALAERNVSNGALVALEPASGHILALVGSVDFYDADLDGQVNVPLRCRQPGSAIKPLTYLTAMEMGWTPATPVWDLPVTYTDTAGNVYEPVNYDGKFRGPVSVRTALANSLNVPAVKALDFVTVDGLLETAERFGATSIVSPQVACPDYPYDSRPLYGLALTLGGGELKPLELTGAYATLANGGLRMEPTPILWVEDRDGNVLIDHRRPQGAQVVTAEIAYLVTHILSDTEARCLLFRCPSVLELPGRPVAAKTGTTNDNRDAWTMGYTPDIAAGVWVGNNDNAPMAGVVGSSGAGPIWHAFMARAHEGIPVHPFPRPAGIVEREVCALSGTRPSPYCPETRAEVFDVETLPPGAEEDWFQQVEIDANSGLRANEYCRTDVYRKVMVVLDTVEDPAGRRWLRTWAQERGMDIAPEAYCTAQDVEAPEVRITAPQNGEDVTGWVELWGTVEFEGFDRYDITYGVGANPETWEWISGPHEAAVRDGVLGRWGIPDGLPPGIYTLRVVAYNQQGAQFESRVQVNVLAPTATPTLTPTVMPTPTATPTPTPSPSPTPTLTSPLETPQPPPAEDDTR